MDTQISKCLWETRIDPERRPRSPARDRTIRQVQQVGRRQWKKDSGYHQQARVENAFFRYKFDHWGESSSAQSHGARD